MRNTLANIKIAVVLSPGLISVKNRKKISVRLSCATVTLLEFFIMPITYSTGWYRLQENEFGLRYRSEIYKLYSSLPSILAEAIFSGPTVASDWFGTCFRSS
jgi:hypothetical protein